ncbi:MAG: 3-deoxy-manno-octulosonate cytidylyltransferase [Granulosicoccus sp.]|nr:3-deoxy-manno-octulosonate cytidylyltransferase [Granulosicoccus sp.]
MSTQDYIIVIPARFASTRFPGKPLHPIHGRPMILHTADRARESGATGVVIATDDPRIQRVCEEDGLDVQLTSPSHPSGTDRIAEVVCTRKWPDDTVVVGLQGDEPATSSAHLDELAQNLCCHPEAAVATLCMPMNDEADYSNPNRVKVVRDVNDMALYFSRAPIPARRSALVNAQSKHLQNGNGNRLPQSSIPETYLHIGLYAYRCEFLKKYLQLPACMLESEEQLEQLRVLYHGGRIHVGSVAESPVRGVDHPDDISVLEALLD